MFKPMRPGKSLRFCLFLRFIRASQALLLNVSLLVVTLAAQTEWQTKQAEARKLLDEGMELFQEGSKESLTQALERFVKAQPLLHAINDVSGEATALNNIANVYDTLDEKQKALDFYNQALPLFRSVDDRGGEAVTLGNIGSVYNALGDWQKALDFDNRALPLFRAVSDKRGEAITLDNIGQVYDDLGERQKALNFFNQALPLLRAVGDRSSEVVTLHTIGLVYDGLGEKQKALDAYNQALPLRRVLGDKGGEAATLNNIGSVYNDLGEKQKALDSYDQALQLLRAVGDRGGEAATLNNIGSVYYDLSEKQRALNFYSQALPLRRAVGDRGGEAIALNNIGTAYLALDKFSDALDSYTQALPLLRAVGDRKNEAITLDNIGSVYVARGERQKALDFRNQALQLFRAVGDRGGEAVTLSNIGLIYKDLGEGQKALDFYHQALPLLRAIGDKGNEAITLGQIALIERDVGNLLEARTNLKVAIDLFESLRGKIINQELRSSYFSSMQDYYGLYIDVLMRLHAKQPTEGHDAAALQVSERARARSLVELLLETGANIRQGVDPQLVERERALQQQLNASALRQRELLSGRHSGEQAINVDKELDTLTIELQQVEAQIRQTSPRYAELTQPQPLDSKTIQSQLDPDTLLLEYALGMDHSYLWLVSSTDIQSFELPAKKQIQNATSIFIETLNTDARIYGGTKGTADRDQQEMLLNALHLSEMLLGPVASRLGQKRLVIVGDGVLLKLPFAALPDVASDKQGTTNLQPLILRHEIVNIPSVAALVALRSERARRGAPSMDLVVLADPVFYPDDARVKRGPRNSLDQQAASATDPGNVSRKVEQSALETGALRNGKQLERLAGTRKEADAIVRLVPVHRTREALDFAANRELVNGGELSRYRYVHFATHALLNDTHPELTAIVLSLVDENGNPRDGFLRAHEVYNLNLTSDLVVLSACETGLGKEVKGEGLIGLTRGFMYAGTPRVVVSLWSVRDESTAQLMESFYREMIKKAQRPAAALRSAQIEMLKSKEWQAPHYWAAFVLQGEWR